MRCRFHILLLAAACWLAASCDSTTAGIGSGGTGGSSTGPIGGFGSVIVNGVEFDDTAAQVTLDGVPDRPVSDLKLGMVVEVRGQIRAGGTGRAEAIDAVVAARGPVSAVDPATGTLQMLGQTVRADSGTVLDGLASIGVLQPGDIVAVSGLRDAAAGRLAATRIERRPPLDASPVQVLGTIAALTATTFRLDGLTVNFSGAQLIGVPPGGLANGLVVVASSPEPPPAGILAASVVRVVATALPAGGDVEYTGFISGFTSPANFQVGSVRVNATGAAFTGGSVADLRDGAQVEVEGATTDGVLSARTVRIIAPAAPVHADVEGVVTSFVSLSNFLVRGQGVDASHAAFTGGAAGEVANGRVVRVQGNVVGSVIAADTVVFEDTMPPEEQRLVVEGAITDFVTPANFKVNGQRVSASAATQYSGGTAGDLANGRHVAAEGVVRGGVLAVATLRIFPPEVAQVVTVSGLVAAFSSSASFTVNGQAVSADGGTAYSGGTAAGLANGVAVKVTGTIVDGVLRATAITFTGGGDVGGGAEVEGYITDFVSPASFKVKGQLVDASAATFRGGRITDLANGLQVHATGRIASGVLKATLLEIDN